MFCAPYALHGNVTPARCISCHQGDSCQDKRKAWVIDRRSDSAAAALGVRPFPAAGAAVVPSGRCSARTAAGTASVPHWAGGARQQRPAWAIWADGADATGVPRGRSGAGAAAAGVPDQPGCRRQCSAHARSSTHAEPACVPGGRSSATAAAAGVSHRPGQRRQRRPACAGRTASTETACVPGGGASASPQPACVPACARRGTHAQPACIPVSTSRGASTDAACVAAHVCPCAGPERHACPAARAGRPISCACAPDAFNAVHTFTSSRCENEGAASLRPFSGPV